MNQWVDKQNLASGRVTPALPRDITAWTGLYRVCPPLVRTRTVNSISATTCGQNKAAEMELPSSSDWLQEVLVAAILSGRPPSGKRDLLVGFVCLGKKFPGNNVIKVQTTRRNVPLTVANLIDQVQ